MIAQWNPDISDPHKHVLKMYTLVHVVKVKECFFATFKNISVISKWTVLLVEETRVQGENHRPVASHWQTLSHIVVSSTPRHEQDTNS